MKLEHFSFEYFSAPCYHILRWCTRRCSESAALNMSGNLENSAVATGLKRSVFLPTPKKGNVKNAQITGQLQSFHMLPWLCWKSFRLGLSCMWTKNFQMYNWASKRQRNQRPNRQHSLDHGESKGVPKNICFCFIDYAKAFDYADHNKLWEKRWEY